VWGPGEYRHQDKVPVAGVEAVNVPPERKVINIVSGQIVVKQFDLSS